MMKEKKLDLFLENTDIYDNEIIKKAKLYFKKYNLLNIKDITNKKISELNILFISYLYYIKIIPDEWLKENVNNIDDELYYYLNLNIIDEKYFNFINENEYIRNNFFIEIKNVKDKIIKIQYNFFIDEFFEDMFELSVDKYLTGDFYTYYYKYFIEPSSTSDIECFLDIIFESEEDF